MSKFTKVAAAVAVAPMLAFSAPVFADSPGQLGGGTGTYQVKNVTQSSAYSSTASAKACGDVMQFSVRLHNTEFGKLSNIVVKATLPAQTAGAVASTVTATPDAGATTGMSANVSVNGLTDGQSLAYVNGSTKLYTGDFKTAQPLSDGVVSAAGLNVGDLNGSTTEFVNFQAKVECVTPPTVNKIKVCELATKKVVEINEADFNSAKHSKDLTLCNAAPTKLANTGPGEVVALFAGVAAFAGLAYNMVLRRQNAR